MRGICSNDGLADQHKRIYIRQRPLLWLNVVCLDAPLVAISWQWLFANSFHVTVPSPARVALFLTAWLIYLIDRLADSHSVRASAEKSMRQAFCLRHIKIWIGLAIVIATLDGAVVLARLDQKLILKGAILGSIALVYLTVNSRFSQIWETIPLKEVAVGFLFASGTLLVFVAKFSIAKSTWVIVAFLFAVLCSLNCISIAVWERDLDRSQRKHSFATRFSKIGFWVRLFCGMVSLATLAAAIVDRDLMALAACLALSAILLATLDSLSIHLDERTALADLVLLTPAALLCTEMFL